MASDTRTEQPGTVGVNAGGEAMPERIGPFRVIDRLGEGGFAQVYEAERTEPMVQRVAVKVLKAGMDSAGVVARFEAERQSLAMMDHAGIAKILDGGVVPEGQSGAGRPYFAMELVRGRPITQFCRMERMPLSQRLSLFAEVCEAVHHAHMKGVIHRDLKPSNVLVGFAAGTRRPQAKVIDFGVAKALSARGTEAGLFTQRGQVIGTLEYMSPEQADVTGADVDIRADVFSLGVMLYELLTGRTPVERARFRGVSVSELSRVMREHTPARPSVAVTLTWGPADGGEGATGPRSGSGVRGGRGESSGIAAEMGVVWSALRQELRGDLDRVVMRCLERDPERRFPSAAELGAEVMRVVRHEPIQTRPQTMTYVIQKFARRHRRAVAAVVPVLLGFVVCAIVIALQAASLMGAVRRERGLRAKAEAERSATVGVAEFFSTTMFGSVDATELGRQATVYEALAGAEAKAGELPDGLARATVYARLSSARHAFGDGAEALASARLAHELFEAALGADDARTIEAKSTLGAMLTVNGELAEAERELTVAVASAERVAGATGALTLEARSNLSACYRIGKRFGEAIAGFRGVYEQRLALLGVDHPDTVRSLAALIRTLEQAADQEPGAQQAARVAEAVALAREAAAVQAQLTLARSTDEWQLLATNIAGALYTASTLSGEPERRALLEEALPQFRAAAEAKLASAPRHAHVGVTGLNVAKTLRELGRLDEAEGQLRGLERWVNQSRAGDRLMYARILVSLAQVSLRRGELSRAAELVSGALDVRLPSPERAGDRRYLEEVDEAVRAIEDAASAGADARLMEFARGLRARLNGA